MDYVDYKKIKDELDTCKKPLFFFHDDADGLSSFLLLYRYVGAGSGVIIKATPKVDAKYLRKVEEYKPDKIFIVDIAMVEEEFADEVKVPIVWIDHHEPQKINNTKYFNPRVKDKSINVPASYICYKVVQQDLWIAGVGVVGDWVLIPEFYKELREKYLDYLPEEIDTPEKALFNSIFGRLAQIFNFILKGTTRNAMQCVKVMTRVEDPKEILEHTTSQGKFLWKKYEKLMIAYEEMLKDAMSKATDSKILLYKYSDNQTSFTGDLANELLFRFPEKIIFIARMVGGEAKCSLRSGKGVILPPIIEKSLVGIEGYGGGHEHACGCCINGDQLEEFIHNIEQEL